MTTAVKERLHLRGLGGWKRGWKQFRTRSRLIIEGPPGTGSWEFMVRHYPHWKNGAPLEEFAFMLRHENMEADRHHRQTMKALYGH